MKHFFVGSVSVGIQAIKTKLEAILSARRKFNVARYQRKYEWSGAQMTALLNDLVASYERSRQPGSADAFHFIGCFIFHDRKRQMDIIDGQQRLTSLSILLAVARDMVESDEKLRDTLDAYVVDRGTTETSTPTKRITHHRGDEDHYDKLIVRRKATKTAGGYISKDEQEERMRVNTQIACQKLGFLKLDADIASFVNHLMEQCEIIEISVDANDDAFRIFSTVNGRGQPVRDQDILRVTLIENAVSDPVKRREFLRKWDAAEKLLGAADFERYLRLRRFAMTGQLDYKSPQLGGNTDFGKEEELVTFLGKELPIECEAYRSIDKRSVTWRHDKKKYPIENTLHSMALVNFDEWYPIGIAIFRRYSVGGETPDRAALLTWLRKLESLVWKYEFDSGEKHVESNRRERFNSILKYFRNHANWDIGQSNIELIDKEKREMMALLKGELDPSLPALRNILLRLEQSLRRGAPAWPLMRGDDNYSIEHVIPRSGGAAWERDLGCTGAELKSLAVRLGNLCFVTQALNKDMDDKPFLEKKALAAEAKAGLTSFLAKDLCGKDKWTQALVEERTRKFAQVLARDLDLQ